MNILTNLIIIGLLVIIVLLFSKPTELFNSQASQHDFKKVNNVKNYSFKTEDGQQVDLEIVNDIRLANENLNERSTNRVPNPRGPATKELEEEEDLHRFKSNRVYSFQSTDGGLIIVAGQPAENLDQAYPAFLYQGDYSSCPGKSVNSKCAFRLIPARGGKYLIESANGDKRLAAMAGAGYSRYPLLFYQGSFDRCESEKCLFRLVANRDGTFQIRTSDGLRTIAKVPDEDKRETFIGRSGEISLERLYLINVDECGDKTNCNFNILDRGLLSVVRFRGIDQVEEEVEEAVEEGEDEGKEVEVEEVEYPLGDILEEEVEEKEQCEAVTLVKDFDFGKSSKIMKNVFNGRNQFTLFIDLKLYSGMTRWYYHILHGGTHSSLGLRTPGIWLNGGYLHIRSSTNAFWNESCLRSKKIRLEPGNEYRLVIVYDVDKIFVYLNDSLKHTCKFRGTIRGSKNAYIGKMSGYKLPRNTRYKGVPGIGTIRYVPRALDATAIANCSKQFGVSTSSSDSNEKEFFQMNHPKSCNNKKYVHFNDKTVGKNTGGSGWITVGTNCKTVWCENGELMCENADGKGTFRYTGSPNKWDNVSL